MKYKNKRQHKQTPEGALQIECNKWLRDHNILYLHLDRGKKKQIGHNKGFPDLAIFAPGGDCFFIELKIDAAWYDEQIDWKEKVLAAGYDYYIIDNLHKLQIVFDERGIINYSEGN